MMGLQKVKKDDTSMLIGHLVIILSQIETIYMYIETRKIPNL